MYRDKEKQKETTKERVRRYRALHKKGVTPPKGVTRFKPIDDLLVKPEVPVPVPVHKESLTHRVLQDTLKKSIHTDGQESVIHRALQGTLRRKEIM